MTVTNKQIWDFLKSKPYIKSNHEGVEVHYDNHTFLKISPKAKITLSPGEFFVILKKPNGLSQESCKILEEIEFENETNSFMYCVLTDCLFSDSPTKNKLSIKPGIKND